MCHGVAPFEMAVPCEVFVRADTVVVPAWGAARLDDDPPGALLDALGGGFGTAAGLRLHFRRVLATSPLVYRRTFRRIGAS